MTVDLLFLLIATFWGVSSVLVLFQVSVSLRDWECERDERDHDATRLSEHPGPR